MGILTVNASFMAATFSQTVDQPSWPFPNTGASAGVWFFVHVFCDSKFITLFSMLFGVSTYLVGCEPGDRVRTFNLLRRFSWLVVFGLIHGVLIWYGDVLLDYALCGFVLMGARGWSGPRLIVVGCIAFVVGVAAMTSFSILADAHPTIYDALMPGGAGKVTAFQGTFAQSLQANIATWVHYRMLVAIFTLPYAAPLMLIGLGLFKTGVLTGTARLRLYVGGIVTGAVAAASLSVFTAVFMRSNFSDVYGATSDLLLINITSPFITFGYVSLVILSARNMSLGWVVKLLAPLGRMAFTNYIGQSVIMTIIFYGGRGFALFDHVDRPKLALIVIGVWAVELLWSHHWLHRFDAGPLEWVWRVLTYNRIGPIRKPCELRRLPQEKPPNVAAASPTRGVAQWPPNCVTPCAIFRDRRS